MQNKVWVYIQFVVYLLYSFFWPRPCFLSHWKPLRTLCMFSLVNTECPTLRKYCNHAKLPLMLTHFHINFSLINLLNKGTTIWVAWKLVQIIILHSKFSNTKCHVVHMRITKYCKVIAQLYIEWVLAYFNSHDDDADGFNVIIGTYLLSLQDNSIF